MNLDNLRNHSSDDLQWMQIALNHAYKGIGLTGPNPSVGCVVIRNQKLISYARTSDGGEEHAEEIAIKRAGKLIKGSTLYVTLEPCAHFRKNSSCLEIIKNSLIKKVVVGCLDPDDRTHGKSINSLVKFGIEVVYGCLEPDCLKLIQGFNYRIKKNRPFITFKVATSLDGKISLSNFKSKWITNQETRYFIHIHRARNNAILTSVNTIITDDPLLNCRIPGLEKFSPKIFIIDSKLKIPNSSKILNSDKVCIFTSSNADKSKILSLKNKGLHIEIIKKDRTGGLDLSSICSYLAGIKINNLLIESGAKLFTSFYKNNLIDEIILCRSGKILGSDSNSFISNLNLKELPSIENYFLEDSFKIKNNIIEHWVLKRI